MAEVAAEGSGLPSGRRIASMALAGIALTLVLMVLRFPYDRLALFLAQRVEQQTGARVSIGPVSLALVRWAPGIAATGVQINQSDGTRLDLDRLAVRPALALAWLTGRPAIAAEVESARGGISGVVTLGSAPGFSGTLRDVDLEQLPQQRIGAPLRVKGRADADVDVTLRDAGPEGDVEFEARDGMLTHPNLPLPMPFQKLTGEIDLGGEGWANIRKLELSSPLASGHASGKIGRAPQFAAAPLSLEVELTVSGAVQGSLRSQGVAIANDGKLHVNVTGTPTRPVVR
ncbi:MAG TPA: type II secretion system protein GspN [Myxococcota bacterium]|nr:type II secretion system protein GspN [Myxococcota bacterium]